jgi:hypothetical protein
MSPNEFSLVMPESTLACRTGTGGLEGTSVGFHHFCEWFEINVHNTQELSPEAALKLIEASPDTRLDNSDTDKHGAVRWFGGTWVGDHHVRVWYNPEAL